MNKLARCIAIACSAFLFLSGRATADGPIIKTVAGGGPTDVPALSANLAFPSDVVVDPRGDLFVAVPDQHRVFRVDRSGHLTVFAGNGNNGFSTQDGVAAVSTSLGRPRGLALDSQGNLFVADGLFRTVRKVDSLTGIITRVAGSDNPFAPLGDGGPATSARLDPWGLVIDEAGNLLIADGLDQRVRRVDASSGIIATVCGSSDFGDFSGDGGPAVIAALNRPVDVAFDGGGNLFIVDSGNRRIRRVDAITGIITTVAGRGDYGFEGDGGPAVDASFSFLESVGVSKSGDLFISDSGNARVRRVDIGTGIITTVAGNGVYLSPLGDGGLAISASLGQPRGIALDLEGNLFITDAFYHRIRRVDGVTNIITSVAGNGSPSFSGDGERATRAALADPVGVAVDGAGNIFIADQGAMFQGSSTTMSHRIRRVDAATGIMSTLAGSDAGAGGDGGPATAARLNAPRGVAVDSQGNVFIADHGNNRIRRVDASTGIISTVAGDGCYCFNGDGGPATSAGVGFPSAIAVDSTGNLFIADGYAYRIRRVDATTGIITTVAGTGPGNISRGDGRPATSTSLSNPVGVAVDGQGNLLIAELESHRVRRVDAATGIITTIAGGGRGGDGGPAVSAFLIGPDAIALNRAGDLFISDLFHVRRVDAATGIISSIAGGNNVGFQGDGGAAFGALVHQPMGLALDPSGNLFFADRGNGRVRQIRFSNHPPVAMATAAETAECSSPSGGTVTLDGTGSSDPDSLPGTSDDITTYKWYTDFGSPTDGFLGSGETLQVTLPLGTNHVTLSVVDSFGQESNNQVEVRVVDTIPPRITAGVSPEILWPPDRKMTNVQATVIAADVCGPSTVALVSITSSEPDDFPGVGSRTDDIQGADYGTADLAFLLRAERDPSGPGRTYAVTYRAVDASGNASAMTSTVLVPRDLGIAPHALRGTIRRTGGAEVTEPEAVQRN